MTTFKNIPKLLWHLAGNKIKWEIIIQSSCVHFYASIANTGSLMANTGSLMANNWSLIANVRSLMANTGSLMANTGLQSTNTGSVLSDI